jgi:hypothetical protein
LRHPLGTSVTRCRVLQSELRSTTYYPGRNCPPLVFASAREGVVLEFSDLSSSKVDSRAHELPQTAPPPDRGFATIVRRRRSFNRRSHIAYTIQRLRTLRESPPKRSAISYTSVSAGPRRTHQLSNESLPLYRPSRSNHRFVASSTASTLAVSGLSRTSALPVINALSLPCRVTIPTNTNS